MYKKIFLNNRTLTVNDREAIRFFQQSFSIDDIKIELDISGIQIFLQQLDVQHAHNLALEAYRTYHTNVIVEIVQAIESIRSYGLKGKKRNFIDYNKERKVKNRSQKQQKRGQFFYAQGHTFSGENNTVPSEFLDKIFCADSEIFLAQIPDNSIDLIFTSPPYNFGLDYNQNDDDHRWEIYFKKLFRIFDECVRVLKYGGRIIVNVQPLFSDYIPTHHIISNYFMERKLIWKGEILWEKNNYNCKYTAWGSWKSPSSPYLKYTWEFLEIFSKGSLKKTGKKENADITADEFKEWVVAKWSVAPERDMRKYGHPAMFPQKLVERALKLFSFRGDVILDPFNGVGTTTLVAKNLERHFIGVDISAEYCRTAEGRMQRVV